MLSLALVGAGVRFYLPYDLQLGVEGAYPLDYRVPFELPREARGFFYVTKTFRLCPGSAHDALLVDRGPTSVRVCCRPRT